MMSTDFIYSANLALGVLLVAFNEQFVKFIRRRGTGDLRLSESRERALVVLASSVWITLSLLGLVWK